MKNLFKIFLLGLLSLLFTNCKRKKNSTQDLQGWLENNYPGRFQVISTTTDDAIRNLSFKVKNSVVAEAADTMVQALVRWDKRQANLNLTTSEIDGIFANAAVESQDAWTFYEVLKKHGFENTAVSIQNAAATVLVFAEPTPKARHEQLFRLEKALADWPAASRYGKELAFMEASEFGKDFQEIVPLSYWHPSGEKYRKHLIFRVFCRYDRRFSAAELAQEWDFNDQSDCFLVFHEKAEQAMKTWAQEHYKKPYYLLEMMEYEHGAQGAKMLKFKFPFTDQPTENQDVDISPNGYFVVDFDIDKQAIEAVKISYE